MQHNKFTKRVFFFFSVTWIFMGACVAISLLDNAYRLIQLTTSFGLILLGGITLLLTSIQKEDDET